MCMNLFQLPLPPNLRIATLISRSVLNKPAIINNHILENKVDILCITETWINDGQFTNSLLSSLLPPNYVLSQYYGKPHTSRGVAVINQKSVYHTFVFTPVFSTFEYIGSVITSSNNSFKLSVVYCPPSSSMSQPTCPGGAQLGLPTWEQDGLEPGFQVGSKWASPFIKKISFTYALS